MKGKKEMKEKRKKIVARIGAMAAVVLLVAAMTVPCFATNAPAIDGYPPELFQRIIYYCNLTYYDAGYQLFNRVPPDRLTRGVEKGFYTMTFLDVGEMAYETIAYYDDSSTEMFTVAWVSLTNTTHGQVYFVAECEVYAQARYYPDEDRFDYIVEFFDNDTGEELCYLQYVFESGVLTAHILRNGGNNLATWQCEMAFFYDDIDRTRLGAMWGILRGYDETKNFNIDFYSQQFGNLYPNDMGDDYQEGYNDGYDDGMNQTSLINGITAIFRAPMDLINSVLNFEILGINMAVAVRVLISMAILGVVITVVWKAVK